VAVVAKNKKDKAEIKTTYHHQQNHDWCYVLADWVESNLPNSIRFVNHRRTIRRPHSWWW
jgi:hypothetical protein